MLVSHSYCEETVKDIIWEFEQLLCNNDMKINNEDSNENKFEREDSYINIKDYNKLKEKITDKIIDLVEYAEYKIEEAA